MKTKAKNRPGPGLLNMEQRFVKLIAAPMERLAAVDLALLGQSEPPRPASTGPLLLRLAEAAALLNVGRCTLWRLRKSGRLPQIELLPGSFRVRRADVEAIAAGKPIS